MHVEGYMVVADLTDTTLTVDATNKVGRVALFGNPRNDGPRAIPLSQIARVEHKKANPLVNGNLVIHTIDGEKYQLHFRRKSQEQFAALASALKA